MAELTPNRIGADIAACLGFFTRLPAARLGFGETNFADALWAAPVAGAVVGLVAGIFAVFGLIYLLHAAAWGIWQATGTDTSFWIGFLVVAVVLFILGALAALIAYRAVKKGSPPTPAMAIEEGRLIRETVSSSRPATPIGPSGTVAAPTEGRR